MERNGLQASSLTDCKDGSVSFTVTILRPIHTRLFFYAALLMSEQKEIDVLVTGLPVSQYMDVERREALKSRLEGEHQITPKRSVAVKSVVVVPQPAECLHGCCKFNQR